MKKWSSKKLKVLQNKFAALRLSSSYEMSLVLLSAFVLILLAEGKRIPMVVVTHLGTTDLSTSMIIRVSIKTTLHSVDAVNQGNWSLSIKLRLACFVIVE